MLETCWCCFLEIPEGEANPGTHSVNWGPGVTLTAYVSVCIACRRLECDVANPEGCKRPERWTPEFQEQPR